MSIPFASAADLQQLLLQFAFNFAQLHFCLLPLLAALVLNLQDLIERGDELLVGMLDGLNVHNLSLIHI